MTRIVEKKQYDTVIIIDSGGRLDSILFNPAKYISRREPLVIRSADYMGSHCDEWRTDYIEARPRCPFVIYQSSDTCHAVRDAMMAE